MRHHIVLATGLTLFTAGYKFDVSCPFEKRSCAEIGKSRDDARAKCIARNPVCWVSDAK